MPISGNDLRELLERLGITDLNEGASTGVEWLECRGGIIQSLSPIDGIPLGSIRQASGDDYERAVSAAVQAFEQWRMVPAPRRGEIVRRLGDAFRSCKRDLGLLVSLESGKIRSEGEGEVQEVIDICDFAVGQSRMLYGLTMHSERPRHRMYEQWHPLGPVGVITAFNFPVAVWAWNAMIALVAGDTVLWKPSSKVPLCAVAAMKIAGRVLDACAVPPGVLNLVIGKREDVGDLLAADHRIPLLSATGSVRMGRTVGRTVMERLGRPLLELGGNNAVIVTKNADLRLAVRAIVFGAVGTAGQRCTTIRRLIVERSIRDTLVDMLINAYRQIRIGNPIDEGVLMGPLIDRHALKAMQEALETLRLQGGRILYGGEILSGGIYDRGAYVTPCIAEARNDFPIVQQETFAPILYVIAFDTFEEAIACHNGVPQGLSSSIFTRDIREAEWFLSHQGSDCGIANVNVSTSGAEIGGAFGGEKDTGGGREAGSDAWKAYMRRQTTTINWSEEMPLAQGIRFDLD
ncbi:MAG: aldehyde dehydrogenase family protein [Syntrophobacteraceae bacterium]|nr:aldehyde dehydrogenase family protein [Syntrophobacteraceae bacterium]